MEYAKFPLRKTWQSQGMYEGFSHKNIKAIDFGWLTDYPNETKLYSPFTGKIVYLGQKEYGNGVILESINKVKYADGTEDYMTVITWHDNDIRDLKLGQVIKQDEGYSDMGTAGGATGKHCHIEVVKGKYVGWNGTTENGSLKFINSIEPYKALFLMEDTILRYSTYEWKTLPKPIEYFGTPVERNDALNQIEVIVSNLRCRRTPEIKGDNVLGHINKGIYNILNEAEKDEYIWYEVEKDKWIAYSREWTILHKKNSTEENNIDDDHDKEEQEESDTPSDNIFILIIKRIIEFIRRFLWK